MQQDPLSQDFSNLSTKDETKTDNVNNENDKMKGKSKTGQADKAIILERLKRLTKDPEQNVLFVIQEGCKETFARKDFNTALQSIKQAFYIRDYLSIFTTPTNLPVYTAAYIPGRALCYYEIFRSHTQLLRLVAKRSKIFLPGSGSGSELIGISAAMLHVPPARQQVQLFMQDIGDWSGVLDCLEESVRCQWKLDSKQLECSYEQGDRPINTGSRSDYFYVCHERAVCEQG
ncbi:hypothetical protein BGW37DRAFT_511030 [Umbelopsis sp. PMI_123]|nr:hypothetical protein BGW37DRAFT_511030 [Umbelopsis sp. PMI_123]